MKGLRKILRVFRATKTNEWILNKATLARIQHAYTVSHTANAARYNGPQMSSEIAAFRAECSPRNSGFWPPRVYSPNSISIRLSVSAQLMVVGLTTGGSVAEWLACWTQAQKGLGSNRSRDAVRKSEANCSHPSCLRSPSSETGSSPL